MKTIYSVLCDLDPSMESTTCTKQETGSLSHVWTIFTETQPENLCTHAGSQCHLQYQTKEEGLVLSCAVNFFSPLAAVSGACNIMMQWTKRPKLSHYCLSILTVMILLVILPHMLWHSYPLKPWWGYPWRQCHCVTLLQPSPSNACVVMTTTQTELRLLASVHNPYCTGSAYWMPALYYGSTWVYNIVPWLYLTLLDSTWLFSTLLDCTVFYYGSTRVYSTVPWLYCICSLTPGSHFYQKTVAYCIRVVVSLSLILPYNHQTCQGVSMKVHC